MKRIKILLTNFIILLLVYIFFEFSCRYLFVKNFGFVSELNYISDLKIETNYNDFYNNYLDFLHPEIGFLKPDPNFDLDSKKKKNISIYGDSVSVGVGTNISFDSYMDSYVNDNYNILNFSTENHGFYQISYNVDKYISKYKSEINLITPIAHDLLRPGKTFMSGMLRPIYISSKEGFMIIKNYDYDKFILSYKFSKEYFFNSIWLLKFLWDNRKYYFANYYHDFYANIYKNSFKKIQESNEDLNTIIVILPTYYKFRHKDFTINLFNKIFDEIEKSENLYLINIEECVKNFFKKNNKNFKNLTNIIHPGSFTHRSYAYCIISYLNKMNLLDQ